MQTVDGRVLGTPRYMAPERIRGASDVDGRADIFAAAVVLYETMTGVSPFAASSASASLAAVLERHVDPDARIEPRLWIEIERAISKRPYERHASARELATALRAAIGETEGALEGSLRRPPPPVGWEPEEASYSTPTRETKTTEGQSLGIVPPRARVSPAMWIGAGAVAGVFLGAAVVGLRASIRVDGHGQPAAAAPGAPPAQTLASITPAPSAGPPVDAEHRAETAQQTTPGPVLPATDAGGLSTEPASATKTLPTGTANAATPAARTAPTSPRPKRIATTPGF